MPVLKWGLSQAASDAYKASGHDPSRIGQTIGNAVLSAGTHEKDGIDPEGNPYSAAVDLSVGHPTKLTDPEIKQFCDDLFAQGFWPFPRLPWHPEDGWMEVAHIHCIYLGESMKVPLQRQVHDAFAGRNGLASDGIYHFWQPSDKAMTEKNRELFLAHNPV